MTRYIGCETARDLLDAFVDGELTIADQVMVEGHLRGCRTCSARVEDMSLIGTTLRSGPPALRDAADEAVLSGLHADVLSRFRAERNQSFPVRLREMFADMRLLWPALGATCAVIICLTGAAQVLQAASAQSPESLAALISTMSVPGSDRNPLRLDNTVMLPRPLDSGPLFDVMEDESMIVFNTVVSREGTIANYELLISEREPARTRHQHEREMADLLHAVKRSRFEPAQALTGTGGRNVAVNMVWLIGRITVKGSAREVEAVVNAAPPRKREAAKRVPAEPVGARSSRISVSTTA
jgi:hypothetical protein